MRGIKILRFFVIFLIIFGWVFSGWPRIWPLGGFDKLTTSELGVNTIRIPPEIKVARAAGLEYVGGVSGTGTGATYNVSLTALTGGIGSTAAAGDLVIVVTGWASAADGNPGVTTPTGYTEVYDLYKSDTRDVNFSVNWKIMGGTPDTSVTVSGFNNAANGGATVVHVWRGADQTTPMDVAPPTGATAGNVAHPNSPSITPVTNGAYVLTVGMGTGDTTPLAHTAPTNYSNTVSTPGTGTTMSIIADIASRAWSSGAEDPGLWTGGDADSGSDSQAAGTLAIRPAPALTTTLGDGTNPGDATIAPEAAATEVDSFTFQTSAGTDNIISATTTLAVNATSSISKVEITSDNGATVYGSSTNPTANSFSISLSGLTASTTQTQFKIRITPKSHADMPAPPGSTYTVTSTITAWSGTNTQVGSDATSSVLTIDNLSPNGATATSTSAGDQKITLNWTTSNSGDFNTASSSVIYRWTGGSAGNEVPAEGSTAVIGAANETATTACVVSSASSTALSKIDGSGGSAECTTVALTNGQAYTYKVFQKDSNGNYDVGVSMGSATPAMAAVVSITVAPTSTTYGFMDVSQVKKADTANANDEFIVTNTGNVAETFDIISSDAAGGAGWALSSSTVGTNIYMHAYSALKTLTASTTLGSVGDQDTKWVALDKGTTYRTLKTNVASSTPQDLVLELLTPSSVGDYVEKSTTVTVQAVAYP